MGKLKITFRKEVEVDLNAYYPSFPPSLRKEIDDALYGLLGGQKPKKRYEVLSAAVKGKEIFRRTDKRALENSKTQALLSELDRMKDKEFLKEEIENLALQFKLEKKNILGNLVRGNYLIAVG